MDRDAWGLELSAGEFAERVETLYQEACGLKVFTLAPPVVVELEVDKDWHLQAGLAVKLPVVDVVEA